MNTTGMRTLICSVIIIALAACSSGNNDPAQSDDPEVPDVVVTSPDGGAYAEGEILNEDGKILARASGTFFLTKAMRQSERERI